MPESVTAHSLAHGLTASVVETADYPDVYRWLIETSPMARAIRCAFDRLCEATGAEDRPYGLALDALTTLLSANLESERYGDGEGWDFWVLVYGLAIYGNARNWYGPGLLRYPDLLPEARSRAYASADFTENVDQYLRAWAIRSLEVAGAHEDLQIGRDLFGVSRASVPELLRLGVLWGSASAPESVS